MGPKAKVKAKAKAGYSSSAATKAPSEEQLKEEAAKAEAKRLWQQRKDGTKWATAQGIALEEQREKAVRAGDKWVEEHHLFHEAKLKLMAKSFEAKALDEVPAALKSGLEAYAAQLAEGAAGKEGSFKAEVELWKDVELVDDPNAAYVRPAPSDEITATVKEISAWTDTSETGMKNFASKLIAQAASPHLQDAGLCRIGWLFNEHKDDEASSATLGLTSDVLMPAIDAGMRGCPKDAEVQRAGCAAIRGMAAVDGQLSKVCEAGAVELIVMALQTHLKVSDVCVAGNAALWNMSQKAGKNSPELGMIIRAGAVEALKKVMYHHAWDQTLVGKVRVTLPFLVET